jgi:Leucine-rich repeat (LRR) protein
MRRFFVFGFTVLAVTFLLIFGVRLLPGRNTIHEAIGLQIVDGNITTLPPDVRRLPITTHFEVENDLGNLLQILDKRYSIRILDLRYNRLTTLPPEVAQLNAVQILILHGNRLESLPPEMGQWQTLQKFYLSDNELSSVPLSLGDLSELQVLELTGSGLDIPSDVRREGTGAIKAYLREQLLAVESAAP